MAPVFLYIARNRYLYNTRIFKRGGGFINIRLISKNLTTAKYVFSHGEKLVRTHRNSMRPLLACLKSEI